ncbi:MAG: N-acetylmannosamine-6-phosphate 2-epimerase [Akkermansiaceae bacterium]|nr:N-acetylmannosamine-6-phosphate 2-epimerase [Armatimonadota bacterium]
MLLSTDNSPLTALRGGLIVSCQAQPGEPLHSSFIMARMAVAAREGGAVGIRCESPDDIRAIREAVPGLPIIGLWKVSLPGYETTVYITPRLQDAQAVADAGADIIALDATLRPHPEDRATADLIRAVKEATGKLVMADIDSVTSAVAAIDAGADCVSTTLSGYTAETQSPRTDESPRLDGPDFGLIARLMALELPVPVIAEGRIHTPEQARQALDAGAFAVVVGGAITRPQQITARFAKAVRGG